MVAAHAVQHIGIRAAVPSVKVGALDRSFGLLEIEVAGGIDAVDALAVAFELAAFETPAAAPAMAASAATRSPRPGPLGPESSSSMG